LFKLYTSDIGFINYSTSQLFSPLNLSLLYESTKDVYTVIKGREQERYRIFDYLFLIDPGSLYLNNAQYREGPVFS